MLQLRGNPCTALAALCKICMIEAMARVTLRMTQENKIEVLEAPPRANLLRFLQSEGIPVGSACGGMGLCASCKVTVINGVKNLSSPTDVEEELAERNNLNRSERISCQAQILGDIEITTGYW